MNPNVSRIVYGLLGVLMLTACASPPSHFYALNSTQEALAGLPYPVSIAVGPVTIPETVNRSEIVVQAGPNRIGLDELNRWAAPLQSDIQRVIMEDLVQLLGTPRVSRYPQGPVTTPDFRVQIEVLRFESMPGDAVLLDVIWTVRAKTEKDEKTGRTTLREPATGPGYDALVAAHSRALGTLSRNLAEVILEGIGR
ncbi:MAG TPA: PqiC family protein [Syntrophobacteraceae bacterium]|nr:PqiC family protein [Syntrophobacteraceae bacterium]